MYVAIKKSTNECVVVVDRAHLKEYINKDVRTIARYEDKVMWETKDYIIYNPIYVCSKSRRGSKNIRIKVKRNRL